MAVARRGNVSNKSGELLSALSLLFTDVYLIHLHFLHRNILLQHFSQ